MRLASLLLLASCTTFNAPPPRYVLYDTNRDSPRDGQDSIVEDAVAALRRDAELAVVVIGHADSVGTEEDNAALSLRRASAIRARVLSAGIAPNRVRWAARGESEPVAGDTTTGRAQNRRVEIYFYYPSLGPAEEQYGFELRFGS